MRKHMTRAGVAVTALASLGLGGGLLVSGAAPAGAALTATSSGQPGQTIDEAVANTQALLSNLEAQASSYVLLVEDLACLPLEILLDSGPALPPPGSCDIGQH
jgi:hypothetical protein